MFLIALALGALAVLFPFLATMLAMFYCGKYFESCIQNPLKTLIPMAILPLSLLLITPDMDTVLLASDAIFGVILPLILFMHLLRTKRDFGIMIAASAAMIVLYGAFRQLWFAQVILDTYERALLSMNYNTAIFGDLASAGRTLEYIKLLLPSMWVIQMVFALFIGQLLFQRQVKATLPFSQFTSSKYYSLILLLFIPLYLIEDKQILFINSLVAYSALPLIQGISVFANKLFKIINSPMLVVVIILAVLLNLISYIILTLLGIADQWLDFRKIQTGGITDESHYA